ncbi:MAG: HPr kinase [Candidatus Dormibacteraceae bacterium]
MASTHRVYGLSVSSDLELPGLGALPPASTPADITLRTGDLSGLPPASESCSAIPEGVLLSYPWLGRVLIRSGEEMIADLAPGADPDWILACLLGPALGAALAQRGELVLHASAVVHRGEAIAFAGPQGSGKSTLAASLVELGLELLTDDLLVVSGADVVRGPGELRLWPESAVALGHDINQLDRLAGSTEKRMLPAAGTAEERVPLRRLHLLGWGARFRSAPVSARDAAVGIVAETYLGFMLDRAAQARNFRQSVALARSTQVHRLRRPRDLAALRPMARRLLASLA